MLSLWAIFRWYYSFINISELKTQCMHAKLLQPCPTLCNPWMDYSLPDVSVCEILQARILEWVAMSSSRGSCASPALAGRFFTTIATWEVQKCIVAAAKSLQSCPTLCDPIDSSPPGSPVPGILQARTLEWVAIFFSSAQK